jgi:hypothetical protein
MRRVCVIPFACLVATFRFELRVRAAPLVHRGAEAVWHAAAIGAIQSRHASSSNQGAVVAPTLVTPAPSMKVDAKSRFVEMLRSCTLPAFSQDDAMAHRAVSNELWKQLRTTTGFKEVQCATDADEGSGDLGPFRSVTLGGAPLERFQALLQCAVEFASKDGYLSGFPCNTPVAHGDANVSDSFDRLMHYIAGRLTLEPTVRFEPRDGTSFPELVDAARSVMQDWITVYPTEPASGPSVTVVGTAPPGKLSTEAQLKTSTQLLKSRDVPVSGFLPIEFTKVSTDVLIKMVGPSGCGKTSAALLFGNHAHTVVLYLLGRQGPPTWGRR